MPVTQPPPARETESHIAARRGKWRLSGRHFAVAAAGVFALLAILAVVASRKWPFTSQAITHSLESGTQATLTFTGFQQVFFPHPGCILTNVTLQRGSDGKQVKLTIPRLVIFGSYFSLLSRHVRLIRADHAHFSLVEGLPGQSAAARASTSGGLFGLLPVEKSVIDELSADDVVADFVTAASTQPLEFRMSSLRFDNLGDNRKLAFHAQLHNPVPPAEVAIQGTFGPMTDQTGQARLSGSYDFEQGDLGVFQGVAGTLASKGSFEGVLQHIRVQGSATVPNFEVTSAGHAMKLDASFDAIVNALNGDVAFQPAKVRFGSTTLLCNGGVQGESTEPGRGKTVRVFVSRGDGRVQDLLTMFVHDRQPTMTGTIQLRANITLPPGQRPFLRRLEVDGDAAIAGGQMTDAQTQKNVEMLSMRAQGWADKIEDDQDKDNKDGGDRVDGDLEHVSSQVKGHVSLRNGTASLSNVRFDVPGAAADVDGRYNLLNTQIDAHGRLKMEAPLSKATSGIKSVLLRIVPSLDRHRTRHGEETILSLAVGGTYQQPSFTVTPFAKDHDKNKK